MTIQQMIKIKKLLKKLEWSGQQQGQGYGYMGSGNDGPIFPACSICQGVKPNCGGEREFGEEYIGHRPRCQMKILLKEINDESDFGEGD